MQVPVAEDTAIRPCRPAVERAEGAHHRRHGSPVGPGRHGAWRLRHQEELAPGNGPARSRQQVRGDPQRLDGAEYGALPGASPFGDDGPAVQ